MPPAASLHYCLQAVAELWEAALACDRESVSRQLSRRRFHEAVAPNTCHPISREWLVLQICDTCILSNDLDQRLTSVLIELEMAGWNLTVQHPRTFQNALHTLVAQPQRYHIACRFAHLVRMAVLHRTHARLLAVRNREWQLPEHVATVHREREAAVLRVARRSNAIEQWHRAVASIRPALARRVRWGMRFREEGPWRHQTLRGVRRLELLQACESDSEFGDEEEQLEVASNAGTAEGW